jgi:hypothetical protein
MIDMKYYLLEKMEIMGSFGTLGLASAAGWVLTTNSQKMKITKAHPHLPPLYTWTFLFWGWFFFIYKKP